MERIEKLMKLVDMITSKMINVEYHAKILIVL